MLKDDVNEKTSMALEVSILYWRCKLNGPASVVAIDERFQFSIGDATHITATYHINQHQRFQFSIGDAKKVGGLAVAKKLMTKVSILYWRCGQPQKTRKHNPPAILVSILYWRCKTAG